MTDLQSRAKAWLHSLITEVQARELPEELFPVNRLTVDEAVYDLDTVGMEMINLQYNPLEELMEEFPDPKKMTDEELGQELHSAWVNLSPTPPD